MESAFADHRTYIYKGKEVDQQVHLGFDLASFAGTPIVSANRGIVLFADELGIYGNCVIIDHGMGVQSLYGHLSSIDVKAGQTVEKEQQIGRSGMTGMAGGDHLHFTMLVNGKMVNPVEWWDAHWIEDRILQEAPGAPASGSLSRSRAASSAESMPTTCRECRARSTGCDAACCVLLARRRPVRVKSRRKRDAAARREARRRGEGRQRRSGRVTVEVRCRRTRRSSSAAIRSASSAHKDGATSETFVSENGGLGNVFVYVKDGLGKLLLRRRRPSR